MENGDRPAAGAHWIERAPDNFREGVIEKIVKNLSEIPGHADDLHLNKVASNYEAKVFSHSDSAEDYLRTIGSGMLSIQRKWQPAAAQAASDLGQQQAQTGRHQMRPVRAAAANSSAATTTPQTAPVNPPPVRPPQLQNTHLRTNQTQPAKLPPVAPPVAQLHQTVVLTQIQNSSQKPQPRMNQQQSYQTHNGQHADVAVTQAGRCGWTEERRAENHSDTSVQGEAEDNSVRGEAESLVALNLPGDTAPLTGTTCSQEMQQMHPADEAIPQLTQSIVEPAGTSPSPAEEQTHGAHPVRVKTEDDSERVESERPVGGATDNGQQNRHEQHAAAEALSHSSQDAPSGTPPTQQQNHSDHHLGGEAEDSSVQGEAEPQVAINLPGDTAPLAATTCSQEMQQGHLADEAIPQLTHSAEPAGTSRAQEQTHGAHLVRVKTEDDSVRDESERPVGMEAAQIERGVNALRSLSPAAIRSLASDMGVNLKRAFPHTTPDTMDGSSSSRRMWFDGESSGNSCHKKRKTCGYDDSALDEIRATSNMLVETEIKILGDDTAGGADGTMIELSYNAVSLTPKLREIICASEISTKLLVHGDYPMSSPVILGEVKMGVPGVVDKAFRRNLVLLPEPMSIEGMAKVWDSIVRRVVVQFAHRLGGGTFSSRGGELLFSGLLHRFDLRGRVGSSAVVFWGGDFSLAGAGHLAMGRRLCCAVACRKVAFYPLESSEFATTISLVGSKRLGPKTLGSKSGCGTMLSYREGEAQKVTRHGCSLMNPIRFWGGDMVMF
uniref:Uncharacterized protein n=1 Tax=Avena sativa TaxID=4498 RepID=A0ACD6AFK3_AVESA